LESRDGAVARELASHQCGPGVITGLSLLFRFSPCSKGFSVGSPVFLHHKTNTSKFQFDLETVDEEPVGGMCHCKFLFID